MKLHQLAALVIASESGSLRQAAKKMRLSQPALSRSIRELEAELGVKLLDRTALGVEATSYGKALILRSKIIEAEMRQAKDDIAQLRAATHGDLRIGATPVAAFSLLPPVLARIKKARPKLRVTVSEAIGTSLMGRLRQGDFDFAFGRIFEDIVPHELLKAGRKIDWERCEWILPGSDSPARTAFQRAFHEKAGRAPQCTMDSDSFMTMLTIISQTDLLGVAPHQIFRTTWLQREFATPDLGLKFPSQPTGIIRRAKSAPSTAAQYAIKELRHAAQQIKTAKRN